MVLERIRHALGGPPADAPEDWDWPGRTALTTRIAAAGLPENRVTLLVDFLCRIENKRENAALGASSSHWVQRSSAGLSAGVATLSGGTLLSSLRGHPAVVPGIISASVGVVSAAIAAGRPDSSYLINQTAKAGYERLYWDVSTFATVEAKGLGGEAFAVRMQAFGARFEAVMAHAPAPPAGAQA